MVFLFSLNSMPIFPYGIEPLLNYSSIHILNPSPRRVSKWMEAS